jgi:hypothetical protein
MARFEIRTKDGLADVVDVAERILQECGPMTTRRLHELLYCAQADCMAEHGRPLFGEDFGAWLMGPVIPELFYLHLLRPTVSAGELYRARSMA